MRITLVNQLHYESTIALQRFGVLREAPNPDPVIARTAENVGKRVAPQERVTINRIRRAIADMDPRDAGQVERMIRASKDALVQHGEIIAPMGSEEILSATDAYYHASKEGVAAEFAERATFAVADDIAIDRLTRHNTMFIGDHFTDNVTAKADRVIRRTIEEGASLNRGELAARLEQRMANDVVRAPSYWEILSSYAIVNARSYSSVKFYDEARLDKYEIVAVMDERTCPICEYMDGTIFSVPLTLQNFARLDEASTLEEVKAILPWMSARRNDEGLFDIILPGHGALPPKGTLTSDELQAMGLNAPQYHGRCRCRIVAWFA